MNSQRPVSELREVIYEDEFDEGLNQVSSDFSRADEFIRGVEWVLAKTPEAGTQIRDDSVVWCIPIAATDDFPPAMVFYTFNDRYVWMLAIRIDSDGEVSDELREEEI